MLRRFNSSYCTLPLVHRLAQQIQEKIICSTKNCIKCCFLRVVYKFSNLKNNGIFFTTVMKSHPLSRLLCYISLAYICFVIIVTRAGHSPYPRAQNFNCRSTPPFLRTQSKHTQPRTHARVGAFILTPPHSTQLMCFHHESRTAMFANNSLPIPFLFSQYGHTVK